VSDLLIKCKAIMIGHPVQEVLSLLTGPMKTGMFLHVNVNPSRQDYTLVCMCHGSRTSPFSICDFVTTTNPVTGALVMHQPEKDNILSDPGFITRYPIANISQVLVDVHNSRTPPEASIKKQRNQLLTQVSRVEKRRCGISRKAYTARVAKKRSIHIHTPPTTRVRGVGSIPHLDVCLSLTHIHTHPYASIRIHSHPYICIHIHIHTHRSEMKQKANQSAQAKPHQDAASHADQSGMDDSIPNSRSICLSVCRSIHLSVCVSVCPHSHPFASIRIPSYPYPYT
jgi:hypothetical protein